jgi:hypothetical protein
MRARLIATSLMCVAVLTAVALSANDRASRDSILRRAQVWQPIDTAHADLFKGPDDVRGFSFLEPVPCSYVDRQLPGTSPKFGCRIDGDEVKVKYGGANAEVFAEIAATRLLWALGFGADRFYPTRVICHGCPDWLAGIVRENGDLIVNPASIERKFPAPAPKNVDDGWSWRELDRVSESEGGAPRDHRDALKLLAVFLQHTDSKAEQQRIVCLGQNKKSGPCDHPLLILHDVGMTFGKATSSNADTVSGANLRAWSETPIWKSGAACVGNITKSFTGTLENPPISEGGRRFLASLLDQLSDAQLRDLFTVARFEIRPRDPAQAGSPPATIDEWVSAFKAKRAQIADRHCDR